MPASNAQSRPPERFDREGGVPPIHIGALIDETEGAMDVFDGRGGVAMIEALRAGAAGNIPGGECFDVFVKIYGQIVGRDPKAAVEAERLHADVLPLQVFIMPSLDSLIIYGKQVLCRRLGLDETEPRIPCTPPTQFGIDTARRYADALGRL